ncbi:hypothetical protein BV25DRAFT_370378 [Artomyces pyxidatus]|uniref:Uncharacterized protein n=1 Tax=Artomyces pyxidatus TaxID=48021 RepID=A0ACB8T5D9_9AGAM|nr:hypothetical protein BV25DRAFT_370378 [Artomyces pyxidatus]
MNLFVKHGSYRRVFGGVEIHSQRSSSENTERFRHQMIFSEFGRTYLEISGLSTFPSRTDTNIYRKLWTGCLTWLFDEPGVICV